MGNYLLFESVLTRKTPEQLADRFFQSCQVDYSVVVSREGEEVVEQLLAVYCQTI